MNSDEEWDKKVICVKQVAKEVLRKKGGYELWT